tara:strand:- start:451 stop:675 length:225 start_codon:yes stop_codon:yes gene_type:complete
MTEQARRRNHLEQFCEEWSQRVWHKPFGALPVLSQNEVMVAASSAYAHWLNDDNNLAYTFGQYPARARGNWHKR